MQSCCLFFLFLYFLCFILPITNGNVLKRGNEYPIILVHGFGGWGRNEFNGFKYWGGIQGDFETLLRKQGHQVYTASVGPFSSNWDRACELFAQIKGGKVDYGENHSSIHQHLRYGREYDGFYPEWGTKDEYGNVRKVHLIGHSMGGQTIRMLAQLLAHGSKNAPIEEVVGKNQSEIHSLFLGGKSDWVHSITTIASPNQGTFLADALSLIGVAAKKAIASFLVTFQFLGSKEGPDNVFFDAKLDQWGIEKKQANESLEAYLTRVFHSPMFTEDTFQDVCLWSLSTKGAQQENAWVETLDEIFYYTFVTQDTHATMNNKKEEIQRPNTFSMFLPLQVLSSFIGGRYGPENGFPITWQPNDGCVSYDSMRSDGKGNVIEFEGKSIKGTWIQMKQLSRIDHLAVVGVTLHTQLFTIYQQHVQLLQSLPSSSDIHEHPYELFGSQEEPNNTLQLEEAIVSLNNATEEMDFMKLCRNTTNEMALNYCNTMLTIN